MRFTKCADRRQPSGQCFVAAGRSVSRLVYAEYVFVYYMQHMLHVAHYRVPTPPDSTQLTQLQYAQ